MELSAMNHRPDPPRRKGNLRIALILGSIALVFFLGVIIRQLVTG